LLGILAGIVGVSIAATSIRALARLLPADTPRIADITLHWDVLLFALAISLLTGLLFGLIPAIKMASPHLQHSLRSGSISIIGRGGQFRLSMLLVAGQMGLSVVVITAAGLMLHSLHSLMQVDPGFNTSAIVTAEVSLDASTCRQQKGRCQTFFQQLAEQARSIAGIENVALVNSLPLTSYDVSYAYDAEDHPREARQAARLAAARIVSTDYFQTLGLRLVRGRLLSDSDQTGSMRAAVINQKMADDLWPGQDPVGKHILNLGDEKIPAVFNSDLASVIVGVVSNTRHAGLSSGFDEEIYLPMTVNNELPTMSILLRTRLGTTQAASGLRRTVANVDAMAPVTHLRTFDQVVAASTSASRSLTILLLGFGVLAVSVGGAGVYSLIAYIVSWRTREMSVRLALGATRWQVIRVVIGQSFLWAIAGSIVGLFVAMACANVLRRFLFGVSPFDPLTLCAVPLFMALIALFAAWVPARRAASIDPVQALRSE
jgi:predicted permease